MPAEEIRLNCTPQAGDVLLLTKALGTGIISSANKADLVSPETYARAVRQMAELNRAGMRDRRPVHRPQLHGRDGVWPDGPHLRDGQRGRRDGGD